MRLMLAHRSALILALVATAIPFAGALSPVPPLCVLALTTPDPTGLALDCGVPNGDFELCPDCVDASHAEPLPACWDRYEPGERPSAGTRATWSDDARSGLRALLLDDARGRGWTGASSIPIAIEAGRTYEASAWFKAGAPGASYSWYLEFYATPEAPLGSRIALTSHQYVPVGNEWSPDALTAVAPPGAVAARILFYEGGYSSAVFLVDDVELRVHEPGAPDSSLRLECHDLPLSS